MRGLVAILIVAVIGISSCSERKDTGSENGQSKPQSREDTIDDESIKIIAKGTNFDIAKNLVKDKVTIIDFYADW